MMSDLLKQIFFDVTFYNNHNLKKIEENWKKLLVVIFAELYFGSFILFLELTTFIFQFWMFKKKQFQFGW